jgi:hypothetical protein
MRGRVCHAPSSAGRTEAAALAREGDHSVQSAAVAVHAHKAVGEDAAAEESPKLALDEPGNGAFAGLRAGEESLELRLDYTVEDALLGAASRVAVLLVTSAGAMPMGNRKSVEAHPRKRLPAPYPLPGASRRRLGAPWAEIESVRSRPVDNSWSRLPQPSSWPAAAVTACRSWNSSRLPGIWRQECLDRCEPFLAGKPHASLPIADRPSIHAQLLRQGCLRQSQQLPR